jgi:hypothetical protein
MASGLYVSSASLRMKKPRCAAGTGLPQLRQYLLDRSEPGDWTLDAEEATDSSADDLAKEVVREKLFSHFYQGQQFKDDNMICVCVGLEMGEHPDLGSKLLY